MEPDVRLKLMRSPHLKKKTFEIQKSADFFVSNMGVGDWTKHDTILRGSIRFLHIIDITLSYKMQVYYGAVLF